MRKSAFFKAPNTLKNILQTLYFLLFAIGLFFIQSCKTVQPAVYPDPVIGNAAFDYWIHSPLHPDTKQAVTFKTKVADEAGIVKIELEVYEYELYENKDGLPSKRRRIDSEWGKVYAWNFEGENTEESVEFTYERGFQAFTNIEYIFRVFNTKGELSERLAIFDAGDAKWPLDKITLYATSRNPLTNSINLCLFPDTDYEQDWRGFLTDMEAMIYQGFHQNNKIKSHKKNWQFYYTQREADGYAISKDFYDESVFPSFVKNSEIQGIDAYGLMHQQPYSDGAYLKNNIHFLTYSLFTSESYNFGTAVHESAHAIFNLSDEYDLCACFEHPEGANVFSSLKRCQYFNQENGFPISDCTPLEHLNGQSWYMSEPMVMFETKEHCEAFNKKEGYTKGSCERFKDHDGSIYFRAVEGLCIMQDDGDNIVRDFKRTCSTIIDNFYKKLQQQTELAYSNSVSEIKENIYGYEQVILMEMINEADNLAFRIKGIQQGIPKKNITQRDALKIDFLQASGDKYSLSLPPPDHAHIHNSETADELINLPAVHYTFAIPYNDDLQTVIWAQLPDKHEADSQKLTKTSFSKISFSKSLKEAKLMSGR